MTQLNALQFAKELIDGYWGQAVACCDENLTENYELPFSLSAI
ncbi:hypothetical protein ACOI22_09565 [Glaciecola sp. 2405UD65-10]